MLDGFDRSWLHGVTNAFLIRSPDRVLASYARKWSDVSLRDIGFVEQAELFDLVADRLGRAPPVIDAEDVLADPRGTLTALCAACGITFDPAMLAWPEGSKVLRRRMGAALVQCRLAIDRLRARCIAAAGLAA